MAKAFWWASLTLARLLSPEDFLLPLSGVQFLVGSDVCWLGLYYCLWSPPLFLPLAVIEVRHYHLHQFWLSRWRPW